MGFSKKMELLQEKNKGKIVLCNCGNFYIATGKNAIVLYKTYQVIENTKKPKIRIKKSKNMFDIFLFV